MSIAQVVRSSLSAKIAFTLTVVVLALTAIASAVIMIHETQQMEELLLDKGRLAASLGAVYYRDALENAIDSGVLTVNDAFDRTYTEIKGHNWGTMPRFHSKYDAVTDRAVLVFLDKYLDYEDFVFAVGVDDKGYLPTHNTQYQQQVTDIPEKDLIQNRTKYMFNDPVGLAAAQNLQPTLLQVYKRATGEKMWDVSAPIIVKGRHWGAFRVAVSMVKIAARQRALFFTLLGIFTVFFAVTVGSMYFVVRAAMKPVVALTAAADQISLGEALDAPIKSASIDEVGQLTKTIDRLRVSMKAAMSRLGQ
jgi:HAMP domain-containing protein